MTKILWYDLVPQYEVEPDSSSFASAALRQCIMTGEVLDSMGGPGYSLSTSAVQAIDHQRNGTKGRIILDQEDLDQLLALVQKNLHNMTDQPELIGLIDKIKS